MKKKQIIILASAILLCVCVLFAGCKDKNGKEEDTTAASGVEQDTVNSGERDKEGIKLPYVTID